MQRHVKPYPEGWSSAPVVWRGPIDNAPALTDVPLELGGPNTLPIVVLVAQVSMHFNMEIKSLPRQR